MAKQQKRNNWTKRDKMKLRIRKRIKGTEERPRISVFRSDKHIYAQLISDVTGTTLVSASTKDAEVLEKIGSKDLELTCNDSKSTKSIAAATAVGLVVGEKAKAKGLESAVFDRNGFVYHGRIKAVAEGARAAGLQF